MFTTKTNVEKIIQKNIQKFKSEKERNLHGFRIGKLYYNCNEYELARRYVSGYLTVAPDAAQGHRLLAECLEKLNRPDAALKSYRTSLELNPSQKDLLLKICELMASTEVTLDQSKALYWCEQAQRYFPNHPILFSLRERVVTSGKDGNNDEVEKLILSELEHCPTDVGLRIRLLQHLLHSNKISDAYKHAYEIEQLKHNIFAENLTWYETVGEILTQYQRDNNSINDLSHEFWIFYTSVLDKIASLQLDEQSVTSIVNCKNAIFNFDQIFKIAVENVKKSSERNLAQEYTIHYHGQLCLHLATLHFKKAKIDKVSFKEASRLNIPLLLGAWSSPPAEMNAGWLNQTSDSTRKWIQRWNLEANYRASQAGHILLSILGEHPTNFSDKLVQICSGNWRERLFKLLFVTREQLSKIKTSYFITCPQLSELRAVVPSQIELSVYDDTAQLYRPSSLHHVVWLVLNNKFYEFKCNIFNGLQYSVNNLNNCAAETLNVLDIQAFIYCAAACARIVYQETRASSYSLSDKPPILPVSITENVCTPTQENWYRAAYKVYNNACGSELGSLRLTLTNGIEIIRCVGNHGLNVNLLVLLANTFSQHEKVVKDVTKKEFISTRATLYWKNAIPLLERLKNNQTIKYPSTKKSLFDYRDKDFTLTTINQHLEDGKLYLACKLKEQHDYEKALEMFQGLKSPYATFHQAQIYKTLAAEQIGQNKENVTSEMRSQHIIFLSKARDCFYLTLDRLKEPSIDRKHPLNCELGTEIENIESMLSRIDPDICTNQNDCENISDENISSVGSMGDHIQIASTFGLNYSNGNGVNRNNRSRNITMQSTPFRNVDLDTSIRRTEARPSPERLEAQIRQMSVTKDTFVTHILEQNRQILEQNRSMLDAYRTLSEEIRNLKDEVRNELTTIKESLTDQLPMIKKEISELKKDTSKLKNNTQLNDEDLYDVFEGISNDNDYNIQAAIQAASSAFNQSPLYSGFNTRPPLNYPAAAMYPGMYPPKMYGYHPGLSAAHTSQATGAPLVQPVVSIAASHIPGLSLQTTIPSALGITPKDVSSPIISQPNIYKATPNQKSSQDEDAEEEIEDVYEDEDYDYNIHAAAAASNAFNQYSGITPRPPLNYPAAAAAAAAAAVMYPGMYPPTMYGYHPALSATLPYGDSSQLPTINLNPAHTSQSVGAPLVQSVVSQSHISSLPQLSSSQISNLGTPAKDSSNNALVNKAPPVNVVITASDPVPTTVTTSQPLLSVTIPPQHLKGNIQKTTTTQSQPHSYQISLPSSIPSFPTFSTTMSPATTSAAMPVTTNNLLSNVSAPIFTSLTDQKTDNKNKLFGLQSDTLQKSLLGTSPFKNETAGEDANKSNISTTSFDEQDPCPDFKPIIPLPDEIVVKTGEEDEEVLFKDRAKLFRYVDREWKERGVGDVKILHDSKSGKVRLLMRRDQIHKICANHYITTTMELTTLSTSDRAYVWAANDFADEEVRLEKLCIRFKTPEQSKKFYDAFENAKKLIRDTPASDQVTSPSNQVPSSSQNNKILTTSTSTAPTTTTTAPAPTSLGGFTFSSTPIFEPKKIEVTTKEEKPPLETTPVKQSPFAGFSFKPASTTVDFAPLRKPNLDPSGTPKTQQPEIKGYFSPKDPNLQPFSVVSTALTSSPLITTNTMSGTPKTSAPKVDTKEDDSEEFVPTAEFNPVIPLPDLVEVKTGEEDEEVLFCERAKLFRYDSENKEWKERGLGEIKILLSGIVRLLMRREQILKICCNHQVTKTMKFMKVQTNDKLVSWAAQDFSENELKNELFQIRFKTAEIASKFITTLENCQKDMDSGNFIEVKSSDDNKVAESVKPVVSSSNSWGDQFKPKAGQWECKACYITNNADVLYCIACDSPKDDTVPKKEKTGITFATDPSAPKFTFGIPPSTKPAETAQKGWGDQFKPKSGSWECKNCYVTNDQDKVSCVACNMSKDGTTVTSTISTKTEDKSTPKFTFGIPAQTSTANTTKTLESTPKTIQSSWGDEFKPKPGNWSCKSCYISNDASSQQCIACNTQKDGTVAPQQSNILGGDTPTKFTFGIPQSTTPIFGASTTPKPTTAGFTFGTAPVSTTPKFSFQKDDGTEKKDDTFGFQFNKSTPLFGTPKTTASTDQSSKETPKYTFGSPDKFEFVFTPRSPRKSCGEESDGNATEDEGEHIHFTPIIPLPEKIDVKTGEEDEDVLYCHRAKLFIFASGEWKERGLGDIKLLRHKETGKLRMVMRRDQVLKICLNHALTKDVEYLVKDDKSWLFSVPDFSEGQIEHHQFCIRFKTSDIAKDFRAAISNALESTQQTKEKETSKKNENRDKNDNDDVVLVLPQVSPELVKKAKDLMLPDLFYTYLDKPPCKGCIGCDPDSYEFKQTETVEKPTESFSFSKAYSSLSPDASKLKSIFGGSPSKEEEKEPDTTSQVKSIFGNAKTAFGSANFSFGKSSLSGGNTGNIFSGTPSPQQNIFSGKNTTPDTSQTTPTPDTTSGGLKPSLFGQVTPNNTSIFGSTASKNLFGLPKPEGFSVSSENKLNTSGSIFGTNSTSIFSTPSFGSTTTNVFGGNTTSTTELNKSGNIFGKSELSKTATENKPTDENKPKEESGFGSLKSETFVDFSSLAQTSTNQTIFSEKNKSFQFEGAGAPVFASLKKLPMKTKVNESGTENDENDEAHVQDDEYDPHYEPIVPMPEMIQVSTGEEDEEKLFCHRAKLFRYDTKLKEWKERGVGEMKILHHPQRQTYRFILRREQVHKLVLNQLIRADMELKKLNKADNAFCWGGYNYCGDGEDSGVIEEFAIRFKNQQLAEQFYNTVIKCQEELKKIIPAQIPVSVEEKDLNNAEGETEDYDDEEWDDEDDEEEEEEDYNEEEYDKSVVWEKHCKLQMYVDGKFTPIGEGDIQIICDTTTYENRIFFANEDGEVLTNTAIVPSVTMEQNDNVCTWTAVEDVIKDNVTVTLRGEFDTAEDAEEFYESFKEST